MIAFLTHGRGSDMKHNLFIAYDLMSPGQNYDKVIGAIKELGLYHQFQLSLFYVNTALTSNEAFAHVRKACDANDKLAVIDASGGVLSTWDRPAIDAINAIWFSP